MTVIASHVQVCVVSCERAIALKTVTRTSHTLTSFACAPKIVCQLGQSPVNTKLVQSNKISLISYTDHNIGIFTEVDLCLRTFYACVSLITSPQTCRRLVAIFRRVARPQSAEPAMCIRGQIMPLRRIEHVFLVVFFNMRQKTIYH